MQNVHNAGLYASWRNPQHASMLLYCITSHDRACCAAVCEVAKFAERERTACRLARDSCWPRTELTLFLPGRKLTMNSPAMHDRCPRVHGDAFAAGARAIEIMLTGVLPAGTKWLQKSRDADLAH